MNNRIGVVVLAYRVAGQIGDVLSTIPTFVDRVYVVNDCSPDRTAEVVASMRNGKVVMLNHKRNLGPGAGLYAGCMGAAWDGMDIVVKVDGDGQMDAERMIDLVRPLLAGEADYAKGERLSLNPLSNGMSRLRLAGNTMLTALTRIACGNKTVNDTQNGYIALSSAVLADLIAMRFCSGYGYLNDILVKVNYLGYRVADVPMPAVYKDEKSSIRLHGYIVKVSWLLLRLVLWRYWRRINDRMG